MRMRWTFQWNIFNWKGGGVGGQNKKKKYQGGKPSQKNKENRPSVSSSVAPSKIMKDENKRKAENFF